MHDNAYRISLLEMSEIRDLLPGQLQPGRNANCRPRHTHPRKSDISVARMLRGARSGLHRERLEIQCKEEKKKKEKSPKEMKIRDCEQWKKEHRRWEIRTARGGRGLVGEELAKGFV
jgi:hypothetical protein